MKLDMSLFLPLLAVVFITLKLLEVIAWSWFWVLAPVWGWFCLVVMACVLALAVVAIGGKVNVVKHG